jgi:hypothetical protein
MLDINSYTDFETDFAELEARYSALQESEKKWGESFSKTSIEKTNPENYQEIFDATVKFRNESEDFLDTASADFLSEIAISPSLSTEQSEKVKDLFLALFKRSWATGREVDTQEPNSYQVIHNDLTEENQLLWEKFQSLIEAKNFPVLKIEVDNFIQNMMASFFGTPTLLRIESHEKFKEALNKFEEALIALEESEKEWGESFSYNSIKETNQEDYSKVFTRVFEERAKNQEFLGTSFNDLLFTAATAPDYLDAELSDKVKELFFRSIKKDKSQGQKQVLDANHNTGTYQVTYQPLSQEEQAFTDRLHALLEAKDFSRLKLERDACFLQDPKDDFEIPEDLNLDDSENFEVDNNREDIDNFYDLEDPEIDSNKENIDNFYDLEDLEIDSNKENIDNFYDLEADKNEENIDNFYDL